MLKGKAGESEHVTEEGQNEKECKPLRQTKQPEICFLYADNSHKATFLYMMLQKAGRH